MAGRTKLMALVAALLCLLLCAPTATAAILGSLEVIEVTDPVWLYPLRDNYGAVYPDFAGAGDLIKELYDNPAASAKKLAAYAKEQNCTPTEVKPDENRIAFFGDLPLGLYLICSSSGEFLPFFIQLVMVPVLT